jgi:phosphoribosylglycinamide formyltransferase-1
MIKIAIFASGSGTNAQRITEYFRDHPENIGVDVILSNRKDSFVLERSRILGIPSVTFSRQEFYETDCIPNLLKEHSIEYIILAGFLWFVPESVLKAYPDKILNIHPALLPGYGGKGMYGMKVHEAVISNHDKDSGITIHLVNEKYDEGQILFQANCSIDKSDTPESLAEKIHALEYRYFPLVIENYILKRNPYYELGES